MLGLDDLDATIIAIDEYVCAAVAAGFAWEEHRPMPSATPLQRSVGLAVVHAWSAQRLDAMRQRARR